jgi:hypothetical protein
MCGKSTMPSTLDLASKHDAAVASVIPADVLRNLNNPLTRRSLLTYPCVLCDGELKVSDNLNGGIMSVNVDGHAKAAHRRCPD